MFDLHIFKNALFCSSILLSLIFSMPLSAEDKPVIANDGKSRPVNYDCVIYHDAKAAPGIIAAAKDLSDLLKEATGQPFTLSTVAPAGPAIILVEQSSPLVPADWVKALDGKEGFEAFLMKSVAAPRQLWIVAKNELGLQAGVYSYLDQLGFRFYYPGDHWKIVPSLPNVEITVDRIDAPKFAERGFFGTGGFGGYLPMDKTLSQQALWASYMKRNRLGGRSMGRGHVGEAFNTRHKDFLIKEHPEYLAWLNGKRQEWSQGAKYDYSNPDLIKFYVQDRLDDYKKRGGPENLRQGFAVGVEPSDGGGHCECEKCLALAATQYGLTDVKVSSISDRVFHLANQTAIAVNKAYPGTGKVSLYAYFQQLAPPHIPIEPNVYVQVIPYGFNYTGIDGDELLRLWSAKLSPGNMGVYDYWAITDWSNCLPTLNYFHQMKQLRFYDKLKVSGCTFESSYSAGAIGLGWWLASRVMWDPAVDDRALLDRFYSDCFSGSKVPMRRMMERWVTTGFLLSAHEIGLCVGDLKEALPLSTSPAETARIQDYVAYIHYMRLYYEYTLTKPGSAERLQAIDPLMNHMWRIYDTAMVHPLRMWQLIFNNNRASYTGKETEPAYNELRAKWSLEKNSSKEYAPNWATVKPYSGQEIDQMLRDDDRAYKSLPFAYISYKTDNLVPLSSSPEYSETDRITTTRLYRSHDFVFVVPNGVSQFKMPFLGGGNIAVKDDAGKEIFSQQVENAKDWISLEMNVKPGRYSMRIGALGGFQLQLPRKMPFAAVGRFSSYLAFDPNNYNPTSTHAFFYVPRAVELIGTYIPSANFPGQIWNDQKIKMSPDNPDKLFMVTAPAGHQGLIWSLRCYGGDSVKMLSTPNVFSFSPEGMLVPSELLPTSSVGAVSGKNK